MVSPRDYSHYPELCYLSVQDVTMLLHLLKIVFDTSPWEHKQKGILQREKSIQVLYNSMN